MAKGTTVRMWHRTVFILLLMILLGFGAVVTSLVRLQIVEGETLKMRAVDNQVKDTVLTAQRGSIYDRNMKLLAQSATVWQVVLEPAYITDDNRELIASGLAKILGMDEKVILEHTKKKTYYDVIKRKVESDVKDQVLAFKEKNGITNGIRLLEDYKRYYPYGAFASTVLGFTGVDSQGLAGVEAQYDSYLTGVSGKLVTAKNAVGTDMQFKYEQEVPAQDGDGLVLTLDEVVQHILEKNLEEGLVNNKVQNRGCAIIMDVKTGAILGMAVKGTSTRTTRSPSPTRRRPTPSPRCRTGRRRRRPFRPPSRPSGAINASATPTTPGRSSRWSRAPRRWRRTLCRKARGSAVRTTSPSAARRSTTGRPAASAA